MFDNKRLEPFCSELEELLKKTKDKDFVNKLTNTFKKPSTDEALLLNLITRLIDILKSPSTAIERQEWLKDFEHFFAYNENREKNPVYKKVLEVLSFLHPLFSSPISDSSKPFPPSHLLSAAQGAFRKRFEALEEKIFAPTIIQALPPSQEEQLENIKNTLLTNPKYFLEVGVENFSAEIKKFIAQECLDSIIECKKLPRGFHEDFDLILTYVTILEKLIPFLADEERQSTIDQLLSTAIECGRIRFATLYQEIIFHILTTLSYFITPNNQILPTIYQLFFSNSNNHLTMIPAPSQLRQIMFHVSTNISAANFVKDFIKPLLNIICNDCSRPSQNWAEHLRLVIEHIAKLDDFDLMFSTLTFLFSDPSYGQILSSVTDKIRSKTLNSALAKTTKETDFLTVISFLIKDNLFNAESLDIVVQHRAFNAVTLIQYLITPFTAQFYDVRPRYIKLLEFTLGTDDPKATCIIALELFLNQNKYSQSILLRLFNTNKLPLEIFTQPINFYYELAKINFLSMLLKSLEESLSIAQQTNIINYLKDLVKQKEITPMHHLHAYRILARQFVEQNDKDANKLTDYLSFFHDTISAEINRPQQNQETEANVRDFSNLKFLADELAVLNKWLSTTKNPEILDFYLQLYLIVIQNPGRYPNCITDSFDALADFLQQNPNDRINAVSNVVNDIIDNIQAARENEKEETKKPRFSLNSNIIKIITAFVPHTNDETLIRFFEFFLATRNHQDEPAYPRQLLVALLAEIKQRKLLAFIADKIDNVKDIFLSSKISFSNSTHTFLIQQMQVLLLLLQHSSKHRVLLKYLDGSIFADREHQTPFYTRPNAFYETLIDIGACVASHCTTTATNSPRDPYEDPSMKALNFTTSIWLIIDKLPDHRNLNATTTDELPKIIQDTLVPIFTKLNLCCKALRHFPNYTINGHPVEDYISQTRKEIISLFIPKLLELKQQNILRLPTSFLLAIKFYIVEQLSDMLDKRKSFIAEQLSKLLDIKNVSSNSAQKYFSLLQAIDERLKLRQHKSLPIDLALNLEDILRLSASHNEAAVRRFAAAIPPSEKLSAKKLVIYRSVLRVVFFSGTDTADEKSFDKILEPFSALKPPSPKPNPI